MLEKCVGKSRVELVVRKGECVNGRHWKPGLEIIFSCQTLG